jgi:hypothetical protein
LISFSEKFYYNVRASSTSRTTGTPQGGNCGGDGDGEGKGKDEGEGGICGGDEGGNDGGINGGNDDRSIGDRSFATTGELNEGVQAGGQEATVPSTSM